MNKGKEGNSLLRFLAGIGMLVAGGFWFCSIVEVKHIGMGAMRVGNSFTIPSGLVVVPFIIGIIWLFVDFDSFLPKLMTGLGLLIIIASVIMNTELVMTRQPLYNYLLILVLIFGGLGIVLKILFQPLPGEKEKKIK